MKTIEEAMWTIYINRTEDNYYRYILSTPDELMATDQDREDECIMDMIIKGEHRSNKFETHIELFQSLGTYCFMALGLKYFTVKNKL